MNYTKEQFENTAFEAVKKGDGKRIIAFYEALGFKKAWNMLGDGIDHWYYGIFEGSIDCDNYYNELSIKPFSIIEQWERYQAQKELEKVNEATKQMTFTENVLEAIRTIEDESDSILDYSDNSITVSVKMHGITNSVSIQDDDCTIQKMASLFNSVLLGSGYSQKVINQVLKNFEK